MKEIRGNAPLLFLDQKEISNWREVPNVTKNLDRSFMRADVPALAMMRNYPWNAEELCYFEKKKMLSHKKNNSNNK